MKISSIQSPYQLSLASKTGVLILACLLLGGCASRIKTSQYPTGREAEIPSASSYCWANNGDSVVMETIDPTGGHPKQFDHTVRRDIESVLAAKGYEQTGCEAASFRIDYRMGLHTDIAAADNSSEDSIHQYGPKWSVGSGNGSTEVSYKGLSKGSEEIITLQHGTLHIVAFTPEAEILWHGSAEKTLDDRDPIAKRIQTVSKATQKLITKFPVKSR